VVGRPLLLALESWSLFLFPALIHWALREAVTVGSRFSVPKACSYWARFWPSTLNSALACCGLKKIP